MFKEISIDGLECIGKGGTGECYRLDEDKIIKLYYDGIPEERAVCEKECARTALTIGVPTAISYDKVRVGNRTGVIYEELRGYTLAEAICKQPERIAEYGTEFARIAHTLHDVKGDFSKFPKSTDVIRSEVSKIDYADSDTIARIYAFLDELDEYDSYVHGDFHLNNVMICDGESRIIDLGGFSVGCPMFDIATLYFQLFEAPEIKYGERSSFTGLTKEQHSLFWEAFISAYFENDSYDMTLIKDVVLLKKLRFERLYPTKCNKPDYYESIRNEVCQRWGFH